MSIHTLKSRFSSQEWMSVGQQLPQRSSRGGRFPGELSPVLQGRRLAPAPLPLRLTSPQACLWPAAVPVRRREAPQGGSRLLAPLKNTPLIK